MGEASRRCPILDLAPLDLTLNKASGRLTPPPNRTHPNSIGNRDPIYNSHNLAETILYYIISRKFRYRVNISFNLPAYSVEFMDQIISKWISPRQRKWIDQFVTFDYKSVIAKFESTRTVRDKVTLEDFEKEANRIFNEYALMCVGEEKIFRICCHLVLLSVYAYEKGLVVALNEIVKHVREITPYIIHIMEFGERKFRGQ